MLFSTQSPINSAPTTSPSGSNPSQGAITDIFKSKSRTFSAEVIPPRNGADTTAILRQLETMKSHGVDFISVTKGAGGSLRGGTLPIAQLIKSNYGTCSLAHFTCRDYNVEEVENALMDHHYFGIRNILALRGDPPDGKVDHFKEAPNRHQYAYQLVKQIKDLNEGRYLVRDGYDSKKSGTENRLGQATNFCIGVAAYPEEEKGVEYFNLKVKAGAHFGITQMIFNAEPYGQFLNAIESENKTIPILPGLRIITTKATADRMVSKFGVKIPASFIEKLDKAKTKEDGRKIGLEFTYELSQKLLALGAPGIHLFIMNDEQTAGELLRTLR